MMSPKIVFIIKTDINTDGRVLNELQILNNSNENILIDFIILPDKPFNVDLGRAVSIHTINCFIRNSRWLRFFTVFEFAMKSTRLLFKLRPHLIHAQDSAVVLPVLLYKLFNHNVKIIYDDHEIPNENESLENRVIGFIENVLIRKADAVIFANKERMDFLREKMNLKNRLSYFLNLPYNLIENGINRKLNEHDKTILSDLDYKIKNGTKFIVHQGVIAEQRGSKELAEFSKILPTDYKILLIGGNQKGFDDFVKKYNVDMSSFYFVGSVNYENLSKYWKKGITSIVMYLPKYLNNRLCAPNRLYLSAYLGLPIIVNKDNPVLSNFINKYNCGLFIEDLNTSNLKVVEEFKHPELALTFEQLKQAETKSFVSVYRDLLGI